MVQKATRSEASSQNSLVPKRDWPEVRGEECRPQTILSWLLAKWFVGESEEAGRRTLSSHGPENPEEKEIALSLRKWVPLALGPAAEQKQMKQKILLPALHQGKELFSPSPEKEQTPTSPGRPRQGRFVDFLDHLEPGRGAPLSCERLDAPAYVSIRPGAEQLWRTQEGVHGDGQTEAWPRGQRWMVHHARAGCAGSPRSAAVPPRTAGQSPRRCRRTALPGIWGRRESVPCRRPSSARLSQRWRYWTTMVDIAFPRDRAVTFVARRAKSVAVRRSCINPGSVLPSCSCLSALAW